MNQHLSLRSEGQQFRIVALAFLIFACLCASFAIAMTALVRRRLKPVLASLREISLTDAIALSLGIAPTIAAAIYCGSLDAGRLASETLLIVAIVILILYVQAGIFLSLRTSASTLWSFRLLSPILLVAVLLLYFVLWVLSLSIG